MNFLPALRLLEGFAGGGTERCCSAGWRQRRDEGSLRGASFGGKRLRELLLKSGTSRRNLRGGLWRRSERRCRCLPWVLVLRVPASGHVGSQVVTFERARARVAVLCCWRCHLSNEMDKRGSTLVTVN